MTEAEFNHLNPIVDDLNNTANAWFESADFQKFRSAIQQASKLLPESYSLLIGVLFEIYDLKRETAIPLLKVGIESNGGQNPRVVSSDSSVQRYAVEGEICQVPHDYCPHCWGIWDFKFHHPQCPTCGYVLGKQVRMMLDNDICPYCENGEVTMANPKCSSCGYQVDPHQAYWG